MLCVLGHAPVRTNFLAMDPVSLSVLSSPDGGQPPTYQPQGLLLSPRIDKHTNEHASYLEELSPVSLKFTRAFSSREPRHRDAAGVCVSVCPGGLRLRLTQTRNYRRALRPVRENGFIADRRTRERINKHRQPPQPILLLLSWWPEDALISSSDPMTSSAGVPVHQGFGSRCSLRWVSNTDESA